MESYTISALHCPCVAISKPVNTNGSSQAEYLSDEEKNEFTFNPLSRTRIKVHTFCHCVVVCVLLRVSLMDANTLADPHFIHAELIRWFPTLPR